MGQESVTAPFYWNFTKDADGGNLSEAKTLTADESIKIANKGEFTLDNTMELSIIVQS